MNNMFHLPVWLVNAICALQFCLYFSTSSLSGLPGPKAEGILKYQGGNRTQREKYAHLIRSVICDQANVIWLLSPSSHGKHFRSSGTSWPQILGAHLGPYPDFLKDLDFDHSSLFHTLSPWFPEQNLVLTCALFFPKSSLELLGTSLPTCPSHISRLQGDKWNPQRFTLCPLWVDSWRLCFGYYLHFEDCIHSYREWAITLRSPWPPFFLHFQHSQSPVIYLLHQMFWVFFPSILTAASFVQAPTIPPLNSLHWSPASFPCWL